MIKSGFTVYILPDDSERRDDLLFFTTSLYSGMERQLFKKAVDNLGKPYFIGFENIHFSISHSGDYWACAFGTKNLGLDLQRHDECRRESIAKRFFHKDEKKYLETKGYNAEDFFAIWSKKESYIKYRGEGLALGLETFSVLEKVEGYEILAIPFQDGYSLCICSENLGEIKLQVLNSVE
jgi:4'-phosphopantetheinyl transferase